MFAGRFNAKLEVSAYEALVAALAVPNKDPVIPPEPILVDPDIISDPDSTVLPETSSLSKLPVSV